MIVLLLQLVMILVDEYEDQVLHYVHRLTSITSKIGYILGMSAAIRDELNVGLNSSMHRKNRIESTRRANVRSIVHCK